MWKLGVSCQGTDYQSVSFILQDIFVNELKSVSADTFKFQDKA
ncbi:hypothetical protein [Shewanella surugensis]|nr:hypothetical protein [Shewanella surugensis]